MTIPKATKQIGDMLSHLPPTTCWRLATERRRRSAGGRRRDAAGDGKEEAVSSRREARRCWLLLATGDGTEEAVGRRQEARRYWRRKGGGGRQLEGGETLLGCGEEAVGSRQCGRSELGGGGRRRQWAVGDQRHSSYRRFNDISVLPWGRSYNHFVTLCRPLVLLWRHSCYRRLNGGLVLHKVIVASTSLLSSHGATLVPASLTVPRSYCRTTASVAPSLLVSSSTLKVVVCSQPTTSSKKAKKFSPISRRVLCLNLKEVEPLLLDFKHKPALAVPRKRKINLHRAIKKKMVILSFVKAKLLVG
ncbi:hypothetical protein ACLOJK_018633 [Asimina triloba]